MSLVANAYREYKDARKAAKIENRSTFNKDLAYRRWAAERGGVYVPATDKTPPNPHLSHVPERDITTPSGRQLTLVNPAYMTRQVHEIGAGHYHVQGHITSLNPIRPENAPDKWETAALEAIARGEVREVSMIAAMNGEAYMRLMQPLLVEKGCLKCHAAQGYKVGDIRGGISMSTPMKPHLAIARSSVMTLAVIHSAFWLAGLGGISFGGWKFKGQLIKCQKAEEERERLLKILAYKNEELESIMYVSAHDFRTPIINIMGYSSELTEDCKRLKAMLKELKISAETEPSFFRILDDNIPMSLKYISSSAVKVGILQKGLLAVCRVGREELNVETVDMNGLIAEIIINMQYQIKESKAAVNVSYLPPCQGDKEKLSQVFTNLLDNAIKYLDPNKAVQINVSGKADKETCVYCVEDNGIGIDPRYHDKIFEIFHQLDPAGAVEGQGLGLTIVRRIIQRQGGRVSVKSEVGKGSKFFIELPSFSRRGGP